VRVMFYGRQWERTLADALGHLLAPVTAGPSDAEWWSRIFSKALLAAFPSKMGRPPTRERREAA